MLIYLGGSHYVIAVLCSAPSHLAPPCPASHSRIGEQAEFPEGAESMAAGMGAFVEELLPESFLRQAFGSFFEMLAEAGPGVVSQELAASADLLRKQLRDSLNLRFDLLDLEDDDEDAPVVVHLEE